MFSFWLINMMSFHVPNHIQVVSKSAFFCVESTDPDQKTKQTEQGCTVLKSWSLQHCLKEQLAWGIRRCLQDGVQSSLASRGAHVCYVLPTFCPSPSSLGPLPTDPEGAMTSSSLSSSFDCVTSGSGATFFTSCSCSTLLRKARIRWCNAA